MWKVHYLRPQRDSKSVRYICKFIILRASQILYSCKKLQGFVMNLAGHSIKLRFIRDIPCLY